MEPPRFHRVRKGLKVERPKVEMHKLGEALPIFFRLLQFYGIRLERGRVQTCGQQLCTAMSYMTDIVCILPYIVYSIVVVDPYYSSRGSSIYWYLLKVNLFTFGLSRLIIKNHFDKLREVHDRLLDFEVEVSTYDRARSYSRWLVLFIALSIGLSMLVLLVYLLFLFVYCRMPSHRRQRYCTTTLWLSFSIYCTMTSIFTAICLFSFACIAFAFVCCITLRHNLQKATKSIIDAPSTRYAAEGFVKFCRIHVETQTMIELIDTVFSKIPFIVILVQISSVSMVLRIPPSTYGVLDEKLIAFCSCITNVAMYCISLLWVIAALKLNQEFYSSCRILCYILVHHKRFLGPVWMKQMVVNFLIYVEYLKIKPVGITLGGYTFAEALENARIFQYTVDLLNAV